MFVYSLINKIIIMKNLLLFVFIFSAYLGLNAQTYIYWCDADENVVKRVNINTGNTETILYGQNTPRGITIDYEHGKLFFADGEHDAITVSNLDGTELSFLNNVSEPIDVFLDKRFGIIYYSNVSAGTISKIKTDGTGDKTIISNQIKPAFLDLDIVNNHIFYTSKQGDNSVIYRANLDGSNIVEIIREKGYITGVAVDPYYGKLYWINRGSLKLHSSNLEGDGKENIANVSSACIGLELDNINGKLYWSEKDNSRMQVVNTDGTDFKTFLKHINKPGGIAIDIKNYCAKIVEVYDTTFIKVTDTLVIDVTFNSTNSTLLNNKIKVYPNPAKNFVVIDFGKYFDKISDYSINIINSSGEKVFSSLFDKKKTKISVNTFGTVGIYFIQLKDGSGNLLEVKKLVLE